VSDHPVLDVLAGGTPDAEEIAALVAVIAVAAVASAGAPTGTGAGRASGWTDRRATLRAGLRHGPDAWRDSARPR
jgi:Acyl-CoA carboxylase epsilon subunit